MIAACKLAAEHSTPVSILAKDLSSRLGPFNELTRNLRSAGMHVQHLDLVHNTIFIRAPNMDLMLRRFGHELYGIRYSTAGGCTHNIIKIREVDVAWITIVREQK
ncbi:hypothetical protein G3435_10840 [Pseudomonas sp. MAFF212428]|uniref:Uncharacterized protein n=1 Tax=Pseudomonas brassicae TaxID=2708063 RepID=A0A6B3P353_9PSED|nr:hypothetical protein [Pseudomonas brassicae]NER60350.1 hypothetical protein [Pseudomonas brassicae]NER66174.1 hypothetical protein [Pseudomonas brassicae]